MERAIEELEWVVERGAKTVLIRPAPVPGFRGPRSFALREFDPFWKTVIDGDILVSMHASDSGYNRYMGEWTGPSEYLPFQMDAFRLMITLGRRAVEDTATALACHGVLSRFPNLRIALVENGGDWVAPFLERLQDVHRKMPQGFEGDPVETFKRNCYISPFHEDNLDKLIKTVGADHVLFGSDFPHPEGLADPCSFADRLPAGLSEDDLAKIMGGNMTHLMKVEVPV